MEATWDASYLSFSWGDFEGLKDTVLVTASYSTPNEKNYTASLQDVTALFTAAGKEKWSDRLTSLYPSMDRRISPGVDTYCLYGSGLPTSYSYAFAGPTILEAPPVLARNMDGDDNQDITDNSFCNIWRDSLESEGRKFEATSFTGTGHMQMVSDPQVISKISEILAVLKTSSIIGNTGEGRCFYPLCRSTL